MPAKYQAVLFEKDLVVKRMKTSIILPEIRIQELQDSVVASIGDSEITEECISLPTKRFILNNRINNNLFYRLL